jgi:hypothetical protein
MPVEASRYVAPADLDELIDELLLAAGPKRNHMGAIKFGRLCKYAAVKLDRLRGALEPFADVIGEGDEGYPDDAKVTVQFGRTIHYALTLGDFRRTVLVQRSDEPQTDIPLTASAASEVTSDPTGLIERLKGAKDPSWEKSIRSIEKASEEWPRGEYDIKGWMLVVRSLLDDATEAAQSLLLQSQKIDALEARCEYYVEMMQGRNAALSTLRQEHEALSDSHRDLASRLARSGEELSTLTQEVERKDKALLQSGNKPT